MLYLFDLDGTLISSYMDNPDKDYHRWQPLPGRLNTLIRLRQEGHLLGIVTNQGGVGLKLVSQEEWFEKIDEVQWNFLYAFGIGTSMIFVCFSAPADHDPRRKPHGTMIREAMAAAGVTDPQDVLFVGDRPEDQQAAADAGVPFQWAHEFFQEGQG